MCLFIVFVVCCRFGFAMCFVLLFGLFCHFYFPLFLVGLGMSSLSITLTTISLCGRLRSSSVSTMVFPLGIWFRIFFVRVSVVSDISPMSITMYCSFFIFVLFIVLASFLVCSSMENGIVDSVMVFLFVVSMYDHSVNTYILVVVLVSKFFLLLCWYVIMIT